MHRACRAAAEFARLDLELEVSVNLTAGDIGDPDLPLAVCNALELWHVDARLLKFELTESAMLANEAVCVASWRPCAGSAPPPRSTISAPAIRRSSC